MVLPRQLAKQFKPLGEHDDSDPHVTVLFIGKVPKDKYAVIENIVKGVLKDLAPFELSLDDKVTYFKPSKHSDECKIAKMKVISKDLHKLHNSLKKALEDAGVEIDDHFPDYKPHVTLAYLDDPAAEYNAKIPKGRWVAESIEIWGCGKNKEISFGDK
jgi:2'-5' RNA ligase